MSALQGQAEESEKHAELFASFMVTSLRLYESQWAQIWKEAGLRAPKPGSYLARNGKPDGVACKDYHEKCSLWADVVRSCPCTHNAMSGLLMAPSIVTPSAQQVS